MHHQMLHGALQFPFLPSSKGFHPQWDGIREKLIKNQNVQNTPEITKDSQPWGVPTRFTKTNEAHVHAMCPLHKEQRSYRKKSEKFYLTPARESYTNSDFDGNQAWNLEFYACIAVIRQGPSQWTDSRRRQIEQKPNQDQSLQWFERGLWKPVPAQRWRWGLMRGARWWGEYALHH